MNGTEQHLELALRVDEVGQQVRGLVGVLARVAQIQLAVHAHPGRRRPTGARRRSTSSDVSDELDGLTAAAAELGAGWTRASAQPRHSECQQPGSWTGRTYRCRHAGHLSSSSIRDQHSISSGSTPRPRPPDRCPLSLRDESRTARECSTLREEHEGSWGRFRVTAAWRVLVSC